MATNVIGQKKDNIFLKVFVWIISGFAGLIAIAALIKMACWFLIGPGLFVTILLILDSHNKKF